MASFTNNFNMHLKSVILILFLASALLISCRQQYSAEQIIKKSIEMHGGDVIDTATIKFDFRDIHYKASHNYGNFRYERWLKDSIHDVLTNQGFTRYINGQQISLTEEEKTKFSNSVNSVIYFALLPYKLDDPAVNVQLTGETQIEDEEYYELKLTFDKSGGGTDYEDEFAYWISKKDWTMKYLAYYFHINEGGTRFRKAYNQRIIDGVIFADYHNFKGPFPYEVTQLDSLFNHNGLEFLSDIELKNIKVK
ncbi:MAG: DUF6503 family protein [Cyclobacteriaceae bacterium]